MLIRSKLKRTVPGDPTTVAPTFLVEFGPERERKYVFKLDAKTGEHTCEVGHAGDMAALLAIKEGYELHPSEVQAFAKQKEKDEAAARAAQKEVVEYNGKLDKMKRPALEAECKERGVESADEDATDDELRSLLRKPLPE